MAVLLHNDLGWFLCHKTFLNSTYEKCIDSESTVTRLKVRDEFFDINTPILMNSEAHRYANQLQIPMKRKKKKKVVNSKCDAYHQKVEPLISSAASALIEHARSLAYLKNSDVLPEEWLKNNQQAREAAKQILESSSFYRPPETSYYAVHSNLSADSVIGEDFVVPAQSTAVLSDISNISNLIGNKYDAVVIDPPWENKSVKRKKGYSVLKCSDLFQIPIPQLIKTGSIVVVWATNNEKQINFIKEILFPKWNIHCHSDWHWVKVTLRGSLVHPIDSHQKKPYENLIVGHVCSDSQNKNNNVSKCPEQHKVIVSVPSSIHSHKPPLSEILKAYLPSDAKCLEIFARYLTPGWTSFGNEVMKLQSMEMFEIVKED